MDTRSPVKRISILIGEKQHAEICESGVNLSALVRDLIEDHYSDHKVSIRVSKQTHDLYNKVISNTGASDADLEPFLIEALKNLFESRLKKIKELGSEFSHAQRKLT